MSFPHHGDSPMSDDMRKAFEADQQRLRERHQQQREGTTKRAYPEGRLAPDDEGELAFTVEGDEDAQVVKVDFGKPVTWVAIPPQQAVALAQVLIKYARAVSKTPLTVVIH